MCMKSDYFIDLRCITNHVYMNKINVKFHVYISHILLFREGSARLEFGQSGRIWVE